MNASPLLDHFPLVPSPEVSQSIHVALFGVGGVGAELLDQIERSRASIEGQLGLKVEIFAIANSTRLLITKGHQPQDWLELLELAPVTTTPTQLLVQYAQDHYLERLVFVDATASAHLTNFYPELVREGFSLVAANKIANTRSYHWYRQLRALLKEGRQTFLYETNVGASLPLIETIQNLYRTGDRVQKIRGVFSGSLSYIFNEFSGRNIPFSQVIREAQDRGLTEPDVREDLSGQDVARKLLILARELGFHLEISDVTVENLIPESLSELSTEEFHSRVRELDREFDTRKRLQKWDHVLRYVGELSSDGTLSVRLVSVPAETRLGRLSGSDSQFEITTERYREQPLVIQGAGAGNEVTAAGVLADLLKVGSYVVGRGRLGLNEN